MDFGLEKLIISDFPDLETPCWDVVKAKPLYLEEKILGYAANFVFPPEYDENGDYNFFANEPEKHFELPNEFFNHEFRSLLIHRNNPEFVASFMTKFGFINCLKERECEAKTPSDNAEFKAIKKLIGNKKAFDYKKYGDFYIPCDLFISQVNLQHTISLLQSCIAFVAMLAQGTYEVDDIEYTLIEKFNVQELQDNYFSYEIYNENRYYIMDYMCTIINAQLASGSPKIGFINTQEKEFSYGAFEYEPEGSLLTAIFIQLYQFAAKGLKDGFKKCPECGNIFATRRTKGAKQSRNCAKFCCEKCRDRYRKRESRKLAKNHGGNN